MLNSFSELGSCERSHIGPSRAKTPQRLANAKSGKRTLGLGDRNEYRAEVSHMLSTKKGIVLALCLVFIQAGAAFAEPSYLIYPNVPTVFRYDVVGSGDALRFNPSFAIGNFMLWDRVDGRIPYELYGAPQIVGFEPTVGTSEFVCYNDNFDLILDGFGTQPHTIGNLYLRFWPYQSQSSAVLTIDGQVTDHLTVPLASLNVTTPVQDGFYSDTRVHHVQWTGAGPMEIVAFSDKDGDGRYTGTPAFRITSRFAPVATLPTTWGKVKSLYR